MTERSLPTRMTEPGVLEDTYLDIDPARINKFRQMASVFVSDRELDEEEIKTIRSIETEEDIPLKNGLIVRRVSGLEGFVEFYKHGADVFEFRCDLQNRIVNTRRYQVHQPTSPKGA